MDDRTREELAALLVEARQRRARLHAQLEAHAAHLSDIRRQMGNPFFYSGVADSDPRSQSHFTGYKSHEPAFELVMQWRNVAEQIDSIERRLAAD